VKVNLAVLPHPSQLQQIKPYLLQDYQKIKQQKYKDKLLAEFVTILKVYNSVSLHHDLASEDEEIYAIAYNYLVYYTKNPHIAKRRSYFQAILKKQITGRPKLERRRLENGSYIWEKVGRGHCNGYIKRIAPTPNIAYLSMQKAVAILKEYLEDGDIEKYRSKFNYYAQKRKKTISKELVKTYTKQLKKSSSQEKEPQEIKKLHIRGINNAVDRLIKSLENKLDYYSNLNPADEKVRLKIKTQTRYLKKDLTDLYNLQEYIDAQDNLYIPTNIKPNIGRDYHFITYFSKRVREALFIRLLGFKEFDVSNMAYKAISNIIAQEELTLPTINQYAQDRDLLFKEYFEEIGVSSNSPKAVELKPILKVEFLAILMGKGQIENININTQLFQTATKIQDETSYLKNILLKRKEYFQKKYKTTFNSRNAVSNLFMRVESSLMEEITKKIGNPLGVQIIRIHDAILIRIDKEGFKRIKGELEKIVRKHIEIKKKIGEREPQGQPKYNRLTDVKANRIEYKSIRRFNDNFSQDEVFR